MTRRPVVLLTAYLALLLALTFFPFDGLSGGGPVDLRLQAFRTINFALRQGLVSREFVVLLGNIAAFVPLGLLLPEIARRRSVVLVTFVASVLSTAIEAGQLGVSIYLGFAFRTADIDDVIVNVFGAVVGYLLYLLVSNLRTRPSAAG